MTISTMNITNTDTRDLADATPLGVPDKNDESTWDIYCTWDKKLAAGIPDKYGGDEHFGILKEEWVAAFAVFEEEASAEKFNGNDYLSWAVKVGRKVGAIATSSAIIMAMGTVLPNDYMWFFELLSMLTAAVIVFG